MPRQSRIDTPGALHHIIARGIERRKIFDDDQDRDDFLKRLTLILGQTQTACYAWALIPNHFHLLLRTGAVPVATVMRRLLTGHAQSYNRRHRRHGHLFQNRYKSILCQEDPYLLELVRYIHLNPMRAGLVKDMDHLDIYPFSGHGVIMGAYKHPWQNSDAVLSFFGKRTNSARRAYRSFVAQGIDQGKRADLTGGGLIRSAGGWAAVIEKRKTGIHLKSDERILGDSDFVGQILTENDEAFERRYTLRARGVDINYIARRVSGLLDMPVEEVWLPGRYKRLVTARSLICFWAAHELGAGMAFLARRFKISIVAVSKSVQRGAEIAKKGGYELL
jgi:REP element-mobilizing transposase RayT